MSPVVNELKTCCQVCDVVLLWVLFCFNVGGFYGNSSARQEQCRKAYSVSVIKYSALYSVMSC